MLSTPQIVSSSVQTIDPALLHAPRPRTQPIPILAQWTGFAEDSKKKTGVKKQHLYTLVVPPPIPLYDGAPVSILAISRACYHIPAAPVNCLDTYDPHVLGCIALISPVSADRAAITIVNECNNNPVEVVVLDVPLLPSIVHHTPWSLEYQETLPSHAPNPTMTWQFIQVRPGECTGTVCPIPPYWDKDLTTDWVKEGDTSSEGEADEQAKPAKRYKVTTRGAYGTRGRRGGMKGNANWRPRK